ncbi:helix-turn-helix domain-containing protein [Cytobacillus firmus]|uniref:helix-turn-helix domain-containing protein n=1 Tax=Cytobacillus firmus TaxID=1399 RepID=UPI002040B296|nr:helix-turn-helix transcriptional regulator [Cytobacillus firmus]
MDFGERLRKCRDKKGYTQKFVADKIGIKNNTLSSYESGKRQPDYEILKKLSDLYEVTIDYILTGNQSTNSPDEMWEEFLNPKTQVFFKDLMDAPEEKIEELIKFWEIIRDRDKK